MLPGFAEARLRALDLDVTFAPTNRCFVGVGVDDDGVEVGVDVDLAVEQQHAGLGRDDDTHELGDLEPFGAFEAFGLDEALHEVPLGEGEVLRCGDDVAMLALGVGVAPCLEAANILSDKGIECTVVNARFVKPLDARLILDVAKHIGTVVTVEDNVLHGGFGSAVLELLASSPCHSRRVERVGLPDQFVEHGSQQTLRAKYGLDADGIAKRVMSAFPQLVHPVEGNAR